MQTETLSVSTMASFLHSNGISRFSPQPITDIPIISKGYCPNFDLNKSSIPKNPTLKPFKVRAVPTNMGNNSNNEDVLQKHLKSDYRWGFSEKIDSFSIPKGLSEDTIRLISAIKEEPDWMLDFRLSAYEKFSKMIEPNWSDNQYPKINFQDICYYSEPKRDVSTNEYLDKLDTPLNNCTNMALDVVLDSVSVTTMHTESLAKCGIIFCSISEAIKKYPDLIKKYLGKVVSSDDNYYAALNSAVFSDGSFCYIPKDTKSPMQISTNFRINEKETGQFERTLIVAEDRSFVEYLEGCTAPSNDRNQLHAAVVELYCAEEAEINYSTVQTWYAGDADGNGGIYNFVTKRGLCAGARSKISWTQVETGSAITWKYPSVVLEGDNAIGEFYSVALTKNYQQADTGTKMIHKGKNTKSRIISKGISAGNSKNCYRGLVQVNSRARNSRNSSQCDSMLIGDTAAANTYPYIGVKNPTARIEHEASTSKIGTDQLFYFQQRGINAEKAMAAMISGFCKDVFNELPHEFGSEVHELINLTFEKSIG